MNWDAGVDKNNGRVGLGAVIRNHRCAAKSMSCQGFLDPIVAEAMAALMPTQLCNVVGLMRIQLEGDAQVVVDAVNSMEPNERCMYHLMADIRSTLMSIPCWEMGYARRGVNKVARVLTRMSTSNSMNMVWLYHLQNVFMQILMQSDLLCIR